LCTCKTYIKVARHTAVVHDKYNVIGRERLSFVRRNTRVIRGPRSAVITLPPSIRSPRLNEFNRQTSTNCDLSFWPTVHHDNNNNNIILQSNVPAYYIKFQVLFFAYYLQYTAMMVIRYLFMRKYLLFI